MSKLYFRYGTMNSGKSTALMQVAHNYEERGMQVLVIKAALDTKGADHLDSRIGLKRKVDILSEENTNLYKEIEAAKAKGPLACVLVDEAQFITPEQAQQLFEVAVILDIPVISYGLRTDFLTNGFPGATRLLELAHSLQELPTICPCGKKAVFNSRMVNGKHVFEGEQIAIDQQGDVEYLPLCGRCYFEAKAASGAK